MRRAANTKRNFNPPQRKGRFLQNGPPQFRANPEVTRKFRFTSSSANLTAITGQLLLNSCGVTAATAILGYQMFQSAKVVAVEMWTPPPSQGATATCSVLWPQGNASQPREVSDTTVSTATPAHVRTGPPQYSLASFWSASSGGVLFSLVAPPGTIIDITVSLVLGDASLNTSVTLVGATIGQQYYTALDSGTAAGSIYKPVSLTQL
jgi:hypothetical protein